MRNKSHYLFLGFFVTCILSCATKKEKMTADAPSATPVNTWEQLCTCQNQNGQTLETYAQAEMKASGQTLEEYMAAFRSGGDSWVFTQFAQDEVYLNNLKQMMGEMRSQPVGIVPGIEELEKMANEAEKKYPVCMTALPMFLMSMAK